MDNETLVDEEEVNIIDLIADQGDLTDNEDDKQEEELPMPDDIEGLKALILKEREIKSKRNHSLKLSKDANARIVSEMAEMQKRMDDFDKRESPPDNRAEEAERLAQVEQEWLDRVTDDPSKAVDYANYKTELLEDKLAKYVSALENKYESKLAEIKGAYDPDKLQYKAELLKLKSDPNFEGLDDDTLLRIVKSLSNAKVKSPRGTVGGGRGLQKLDPSKFEMDDDIRKKMGFKVEG